MPDEPQLVRGIDWKSTFPFTLIFRSFRVAIHPSKLVLALVALVLIYSGGWFLDAIWPDGSRAVPNELTIYEATRGQPNAGKEFQSQIDAARTQLSDAYKRKLELIDKSGGGLADIKESIRSKRDKTVEAADNLLVNVKSEDYATARTEHDRVVANVYAEASAEYDRFAARSGIGLFKTFFLYQIGTSHQILHSAASGNWLGAHGLLDQFINFLTVGPGWAVKYHYIYFTLFGIYFLVVWAIFGGAISRIAAVQVARDEKISFRQALSFSTAKFLSFVSALIIPMAIIVVVGAVVSLGALVFNIPFFGPIIGGALFFLALAAGFIMTLVLIGLLGGFNLMYPTIAVEGSDSFDAISRSFSYLFARPWRLVFYSLVAGAYGTFCYAFVRIFLKLMLSITHTFAGLGVFLHADSTQPLWPVIWPDPLTGSQLSYSIDTLTLGAGQNVGAYLLAFWVYMTLCVLGAFAISFYFSANTIIYILMRHEVDATELDDVYLEQTEEDFAEAAAGTGAGEPGGVESGGGGDAGHAQPEQT